jgi:hypothetical protein
MQMKSNPMKRLKPKKPSAIRINEMSSTPDVRAICFTRGFIGLSHHREACPSYK